MQLMIILSAAALFFHCIEAIPYAEQRENLQDRAPIPELWERTHGRHRNYHRSRRSYTSSHTATASTIETTRLAYQTRTRRPYEYDNSTCSSVAVVTSFVTVTASVTSFSYVYAASSSFDVYRISSALGSRPSAVPPFANSTSLVVSSTTNINDTTMSSSAMHPYTTAFDDIVSTALAFSSVLSPIGTSPLSSSSLADFVSTSPAALVSLTSYSSPRTTTITISSLPEISSFSVTNLSTTSTIGTQVYTNDPVNFSVTKTSSLFLSSSSSAAIDTTPTTTLVSSTVPSTLLESSSSIGFSPILSFLTVTTYYLSSSTSIPSTSIWIATATTHITESTSLLATTTITAGQATGTPNPAAVHCGVHGLANGNNFLAVFIEEADNVPITLFGCYQQCLGAYRIGACKAYEFYLEEGLGSPRCNLFAGTVAESLMSINRYIPNVWYDVACGSPV